MKKFIIYNNIIYLLITIFKTEIFADDNQIIIYNDTLNYNWELIRQYEIYYKGTLTNPGWRNDRFYTNGKTWINAGNPTYLKNPGQKIIYLSNDNLQSWYRSNVCIYNDSAKTSYKSWNHYDCALLPNDRILFPADSNGYILESTDFGMNFEITKPKGLEGLSLKCIAFKDNNLGFISTFSNQLFKTTDGGKTFTEQQPVTSVYNSNDYYIDRLFYKENGELSKLLFATIFVQKGSFSDLRIIISKDDGENWQECSDFPILPTRSLANGVHNYFCRNDSVWFTTCLSVKMGSGVGNEERIEQIYFSPDAGKKWEIQQYGVNGIINDYHDRILFFDNSSVGMLSGYIDVKITFNSGKTWVFLLDSFSLPYLQDGSQSEASNNKFYKKFMIKYNNEIFFFNAANQLYNFKILGDLPVGVEENDKNADNSRIYYNITLQNIEFKSENDEYYSCIRIFDIDGRELYKSNGVNKSNFSIQKNEMKKAKIIFVLAQTNKTYYIKKLMIE